MISNKNWHQSNVQVFWGEIAPCNHLLQVYENESVFLNSLEGFAGSGLLAGESVIIIATAPHLLALNERLAAHGFRIDELIEQNIYIPLDAEATLAKFMVKDWPNDKKFFKTIASVLEIAKSGGRKVRAFGEMVAILWEKGMPGATVQLEDLWNRYMATEELSLFCAYPKSGFTDDPLNSIKHICESHSKIISGFPSATTEILYKDSASISL